MGQVRKANDLFRAGKFDEAIKLYREAPVEEGAPVLDVSMNIDIAESRRDSLANAVRPRIVVYTCNFGGYESVKEPLFIDPRVDYVLFTDREDVSTKHWRIVHVSERLADPRRTSRLPKILAHRYLPPHDISIYIDSSLRIKAADIPAMVDACMEGSEIALYPHYQRDCVYDEIEFVMRSSDRFVANKGLCKAALLKYESIGYPRNNGLFENAFIFRRNTERVRRLNEAWWREYQEGTERDQFVFMYALWEVGLAPHKIQVGEQFRKNPFVEFHKHKYKSHSGEAKPRTPLKIAFLTYGFWPQQAGMEMMVHNLAETLQGQGHECYLYAPYVRRRYTEIGHSYVLARFKSEQDLKEMICAECDFRKFDVIYVQGAHDPCTVALQVGKDLGIPVVLRTHGEDIHTVESIGYGYALDEQKKALIESNIRSVAANVAIGTHVLDRIQAIAPSVPSVLIHNGIDTSVFVPGEQGYLHELLGLARETKVLLMVGRNVKIKALYLAVEALAIVRRYRRDVVLVHAGKRGNAESLREVAERAGVSESFYELGEVSYFDLPKVYSSADLFVFPSKMETFGNVTLEAMSSGLPCVEFDYTVNRDKIEHGVSGFIVPHGDLDGFAEKIVTLLSDGEVRAAFGEAGRHKARSEFSWEMVAKKYARAFRDAIERSSQSQPTRGGLDVQRIALNMTSYGFKEEGHRLLVNLSKGKEKTERAAAAWKLACWYLDQNSSKAAASKALDYLEVYKSALSVDEWAAPETQSKYAVMAAEALVRLNASTKAREILGEAKKASPKRDNDLLLARANTFRDPQQKLDVVSKVLFPTGGGLSFTDPSPGADLLDRLRPDTGTFPPTSADLPLVTVIVPAFNAAGTIRTTLKSLTSQTWRSLEILVVDDCSTDNTAAVVLAYSSGIDPRVRLLRTAENSGPYVARNVGMRSAKGDFITVNDADDWSHPEKVTTQAAYLLENPSKMASASMLVRADGDLNFKRRGNEGHYIQLNLSSIMFRKQVFEELGGWDEVRFGADAEMNKRIMRHYGSNAKKNLKKVLSIARYSDGSLTSSRTAGYQGFAYGARLLYRDSYLSFHKLAGDLRLARAGSGRRYYAPKLMSPAGRLETIQFDLLLASDFRLGRNCAQAVELAQANSSWAKSIGFVQVNRFHFSEEGISPELLDYVLANGYEMIPFGQKARAVKILCFDCAAFELQQDFIPFVRASSVELLSKPSEDNLISGASEIIRAYFNRDSTHVPSSSLKPGGIIAYESPIDVVYTDALEKFKPLRSEVVVVMPCIDLEQGLATAKSLLVRAGAPLKIVIAFDSARFGFIRTVNSISNLVDADFVVYVAQDAFPGRGWLKTALSSIKNSRKGLLGFNDGKWNGRIASFGMVRMSWVREQYGKDMFFPAYKSHAADNEITVVARGQDQYIYDSEAVLIEVDAEKDYGGSNREDAQVFRERFKSGFGGRVAWPRIMDLAPEYNVLL